MVGLATFSVTDTEVVTLQLLFVSVTVTEYTPPALTKICELVLPSFHLYDTSFDAVTFTLTV